MIQIRSYGPWAVITGASSGIGRAFAEHLAAAGLDLVLAARSTDRLASLGAELHREHGIAYRVVSVDLGTPGSAAALIEATADVDVGLLISNAGTGRPGRLIDQPLADLHRRFTLNAVTHLELVHAFGGRFAARGRGGIVLVSALGAGAGVPYMAHDGGAKAYVQSLGAALHHELAGTGVDVTVLVPGNVDTPVIDHLGLDRTDFPVRLMSAAAATREGLAALARRRPLHVPGRTMRLVDRLVPASWTRRMNGRMMDRAARRLTQRELAVAD
ncbi:SDR family NAD(P)-dependent oxidoreductase [Nonomuraea zeae]|uniref:SDR family NAD(P)-dependent oxidoreductase n=1 Tax=Nonomuraea zeae TaxID=1642303 RepID=A0A5S4F7W4_9ACTN|nr:SDR family NAD(P)-dependent oxidoreductase [Nonomuraea zeae]TMR12531.1 SDR family NAD(P)-dependent oxidoreductase [Nonomuraea zeae]